jgi:ribonuclease PH
MRPSKRNKNQLREISFEIDVNKYAEGSCLIKFGNTHVLCTASVEEKVPPFLRGTKEGWVTAEYSMLPRATMDRNSRDIYKSSPNGRALEIQRLIGRSLRAVVDMKKLGERQIIIDCDVLQADGGTRCASITGGFVALQIAIKKLMQNRLINSNPITGNLCAVSCGIYKNNAVLDLDYDEDSKCDSDVNFVITDNGKIIEVQGTAEKSSFDFETLSEMYQLAAGAADEITKLQKQALGL